MSLYVVGIVAGGWAGPLAFTHEVLEDPPLLVTPSLSVALAGFLEAELSQLSTVTLVALWCAKQVCKAIESLFQKWISPATAWLLFLDQLF